jgi:hypothetical protein
MHKYRRRRDVNHYIYFSADVSRIDPACENSRLHNTDDSEYDLPVRPDILFIVPSPFDQGARSSMRVIVV